MSEERKNGIGDPLVSETYRESATERTPASLNETVLRNAAAHANKGYSHSMLWIRPLAWAATIALCLAIVVDVVLPPGAEPELPAVSRAPLEADDLRADMPSADEDYDANAMAADAQAGAGEHAAETAEDDDPLKRLRDQEIREESKIEEFEEVLGLAEADLPVPETEEMLSFADAAPQAVAVAERAYAQAPPEGESLESVAQASPAIVNDAASMAALRAGQSEVAALSAAVESSVCEPHELETAEEWADCIDRLLEAGRDEEAETERRQLLETFPDFEWPAE